MSKTLNCSHGTFVERERPNDSIAISERMAKCGADGTGTILEAESAGTLTLEINRRK